ncbi:MAG: anti-sigma factor [Salaquimonas sp.]
MVKSVLSEPEEIDALAGEYVLGVLSATERRDFEHLSASVADVAEAQLRWENRLQALNDDYAPLTPPASVKRKVDEALFTTTGTTSTAKGGLWSSLGFWRGLGLAGSAAALAFGVYSTRLNESLNVSNTQLAAALEEKSDIEDTLQTFEAELAARNQQLTGLETQLAENSEKLGEADLQLAQVKEELEDALTRETPVLVVSLESGDTDYRFLAVHEEGSDKVRMTLVSGAIESDKDFELWLVEPEKDTISLGVIGAGKTAVELTPEFVKIFEAGGLLAVSLEQKGGSPTGVAQGPVLAVGAPQAL